MVRVLALDIATTCGWAVDRPDGHDPLCGSFTVRHQGDDVEWAYVQGRRHVKDLVAAHEPKVGAMEAPLPRGSRNFKIDGDSAKATRKILGLVAVYGEALRDSGVIVRESSVQDSRGVLCERTADKERVMQVCRMYGWNPQNEDESDAICVWVYWKWKLDPEWRAWFSSKNMVSKPLFARPAS
jgi:hypothetical protein